MPPKKDDTAGAGEAIVGFTAKETKILAAAFVAATAPDKYDFDLFATLTGNTAGTLKKMWPPIKRKAVDDHPSFGNFLGTAPAKVGEGKEVPAKPKATNGRKRKATSTEPDDEQAGKGVESETGVNGEAKKKAPAKGRKKKADSVVEDNGEDEVEKKPAAKRGRKKVKSEEVIDEEVEAEVKTEDSNDADEEV